MRDEAETATKNVSCSAFGQPVILFFELPQFLKLSPMLSIQHLLNPLKKSACTSELTHLCSDEPCQTFAQSTLLLPQQLQNLQTPLEIQLTTSLPTAPSPLKILAPLTPTNTLMSI